ncbi:F-box domain-containing protein [Favolaschia claudopus]|uniref:F-box domain-containing protein n=1 Tax=Favolaschia claudopus TaxID=2862362 RepID=A0AAW0CHV6_9AGAR
MPPMDRKRTAAKASSAPKRSKGRTASTSKSNNASTRAAPRFRGRGQLKMLPEMPLDIVFEIFSFLEPPDVLNLARTTKDLRNMLMCHSAISIWRSAFLNDSDLPPLPEGLNEPQYANLAFSHHCHSCLAAGEHSVLWAFQERLCANCVDGRFDESYNVLKRVPGNLMMQNISLLRHAVLRPVGRFVYSYEEAKDINEQLRNLKDGDSKEFEDFCNERRKLVEEIQRHASEAEMAGPKRLIRQQKLRDEARERRKNAICNRLKELGYEDEVEYINATRPTMLSEHSLVEGEDVLTDQVWDKIKARLGELMQSVTEKMQIRKRKLLLKHRQRLLLSVLKNFVQEQPVSEVHPRAVDICVLPHINAMIQDPSMDAYTTEEGFQELVHDLPQLFEKWRESNILKLLPLLPQNNEDSRDFLNRATTFFRCRGCIEPIGYPRILAHSCLFELQHGHRNRDDHIALLCTNLDSVPWNHDGKGVSYYPTAEASAQSVVRACGLDVYMTTTQDMDDVSPWLSCLRCSPRSKGRAIFPWRKAILHDMYHIASEENFAWVLLNDSEVEAAEALQQKTYEKTYCTTADHVCTRCRGEFTMQGVLGHLRYSHAIDDPEVGEDYVLSIDASMDQPPFSLVLPHSIPEAVELDVVVPSSPLKYPDEAIVIDENNE